MISVNSVHREFQNLLVLLVNQIFRDSVWINWALILLKNVYIGLYLDLENALQYRRFPFSCGGGYRDGGEVIVIFL